ncbi:MAG: DUF3784 domain-containing protein [Eubacteriaceae bacterium]
MLIAVLLVIISISSFVYSVFLFQEKGPIPTTMYILGKPEDRKQMKTKAEYRFTGIVMLSISVIFLMEAMSIFFSIDWILNVVIFISIALAVSALFYSIIEEVKRK